MFNGGAQALADIGDPTEALVAFGANLPIGSNSPAETVAMAMDRLQELTAKPFRRSRLFRTPAFPPGAGPDFVNAAIALEWTGSAQALLMILNDIEREFGRVRTARWEARIMDLDLIALGQTVLPDPAEQRRWANLSPEDAAHRTPEHLILPHPRMAERGFVLVPVADVAPDWHHPVSGASVTQMLEARPAEEIAAIVPLQTGEPAARPLSTAPSGST